MVYSFLNLGWSDAVDVGVVAFLLWALIAWTRRVHATQSLLGLGFLGLFYLVALQLELQLTAWIFQGFSPMSAKRLVFKEHAIMAMATFEQCRI